MAMAKYILKRVLYSLITLLVLVSLTFFLMQLLPGDPFTGEKAISPAIMENMKAKYGLDKPVWQQYFIYLGNVLRGDLGTSLAYERPVSRLIGESFAVSADLGIRAVIFALFGGVVIGTVAALNRGKALDSLAMFIAIVGVSVPSFVMASLMQHFLGLKLFQATGVRVFAISGWGDLNQEILPPLALGLGSLASLSRLTRTSMLDVLGSDYIKTARAKGLSQTSIISRHALRNALTPVVTVLGPTIAGLLTGGFVVENIFSVPGLGRYFVQSVQSLDYTMISGTTIFYGAFLILMNLLVDIAYCIIDPRVKLEG